MLKKEEIKKRIVDQLFWDSRVDASDISVIVEDCSVRLSGNVKNNISRQAAESDAWSVPGVKRVINRICIILDSQKHQMLSSQEIRDNIRKSFSWDTNLADEDIVVSVKESKVTLEGSVNSYWKKKKAEIIAYNIIGTLIVDNRLAVVPNNDYLDEIIAQQIINALDRNIDIYIDSIDVKVENGEITLSGTVPCWEAYKTAQDIVLYTAGVIDLNNNLSIISENI